MSAHLVIHPHAGKARANEVTNVGSDRSQLANTAKAAKEALHVEKLDAVADRGYFNGEEIKACDDAGITVTLPKPNKSRIDDARLSRQCHAAAPPPLLRGGAACADEHRAVDATAGFGEHLPR